MRSNYALVGLIRKGNFHIARYVLVGPVINSSNDKQRNYSIICNCSIIDLTIKCRGGLI